jgi:hypothetical protein
MTYPYDPKPEPHPTPRAHEPEVLAPAPQSRRGAAVTPAEEHARLKAPWPQCVKCGTLRHPDSLDTEGACRDAVWCTKRLSELRNELVGIGWGRQ